MQLRQLDENIIDTEKTTGSEIYQAAIVFYKPVKMAAKQNIPCAKAIYEKLRIRSPEVSVKTLKIRLKM